MDLLLAIAEDQVPSTKAPDPYIHIFLDAGQGNVLAFFEIPNSPPMGRDENTPSWVQHIAFEIGDMDELLAAKKHIEEAGLDVIGPNVERPGALEKLYELAPEMIEEWSRTKRAPRHAAFMHEKEFNLES